MSRMDIPIKRIGPLIDHAENTIIGKLEIMLFISTLGSVYILSLSNAPIAAYIFSMAPIISAYLYFKNKLKRWR